MTVLVVPCDWIFAVVVAFNEVPAPLVMAVPLVCAVDVPVVFVVLVAPVWNVVLDDVESSTRPSSHARSFVAACTSAQQKKTTINIRASIGFSPPFHG